MPEKSDESFRHETECRYWLSWTGGNRAMIDDLIVRIAKRRGQVAADRLRDGMRVEWRRQNGNG
jgi:hypothetical protein